MHKFIHGLFLIGLTCLIIPVFLNAQDESSGGVKKDGVIHNIAEDREVIKAGGINEPEGLDKYMKRHFDQLEAKVSSMEERMKSISDQMSKLSKAVQSQTRVLVNSGVLTNEQNQPTQ